MPTRFAIRIVVLRTILFRLPDMPSYVTRDQDRVLFGLRSDRPEKESLPWVRGALLVALVCGASVLGGCSKSDQTPFDLTQAQYVGQKSCLACHQDQAQKFAGSHHDLAMQPATQESVLGNFDDAQIEHHGVVSKFFRRDDRFFVNTEGPDGNLADFEVKYVFGLEPLQQYMVEFPAEGQAEKPGELPRVQVLRLCWNTIESSWFYLPPPDVSEKLAPSDDLHWTGIAQRWNNMCAECHSTNYQKNFVLPSHASGNTPRPAVTSATQGQYRSTFSEIDVSCEACHGPGSVHVELADKWFPGWSRQRGYGLANLKATAENQIQACAPCHSRRNVVRGDFQAGNNFYDHYSNQLLTAGIYYPDGQILDEDYVHGSFLQSKMYHKGIKCSDCHDPHTARLKEVGNRVCTSCHQHPTAKYDSVGHHFHKPGSEGAQCVNCHMPSTTYMAVDARRDHSFRIPRPDLSTALSTPNACTGCHLEKSNVASEKHEQLTLYQDWMQAARNGDEEVQAELERANRWCDEACEKWYGADRRRDEHFGIAIAAGQSGAANAKDLLVKLLNRRGPEAPAIARATALQVLRDVDPIVAAEQAERGLADEHPLVRTSAASAVVGDPSQTKSVSLLEDLLSDPIRSVRTEAARNLLEFPANLWSNSSGAAFRKALNELVEGLQYSNDRSGAHLALGILAEQQGRDRQAIEHYEAAIQVEPSVTGPRTNLAAVLERNAAGKSAGASGEDPIAKRVSQLRQEELLLLARDVELLPDASPIRYRYGLALYLDGQPEAAVEQLVAAADLDPDLPDYAQAVALLYESMMRWDEALRWAKRAVEVSDGAPQFQLLLRQIQQSASQ